MKNLLSVSAVFDAREYLGSSVEASFPYPYTFLLSQGEYICSPTALPKPLISIDMFKHGSGFATRAEAENIRGKIVTALSDADIIAVVHRVTGVLMCGAVAVCDCPNDAVAHIRDLEKGFTAAEHFSPIAKFTTSNYPEGNHCCAGHVLHFEFCPSKYYYFNIQLVEHIPASSAVTPLLNWDAIGIK